MSYCGEECQQFWPLTICVKLIGLIKFDEIISDDERECRTNKVAELTELLSHPNGEWFELSSGRVERDIMFDIVSLK